MVAKKNKRGWIKVLESFFAIVLLIGLLATIIHSQDSFDNRETFMNKANKIIEEIRVNDTLRQEIISENDLPVYSNEAGFSSTIKNYLDNVDSTSLMNCTVAICAPEHVCSPPEDGGEIYSKETLIMSTDSNYSPRKLKIFCTKE